MTRAMLAALTWLAVLCSCTRTGEQSAGVRNSWTVPGTLRVAQREDPDNLNTILGTETVDIDLAAFWAAQLFRVDDRNELVPELATTVPTRENGGISGDGRTIVYHLRRGVRWHDGARFGADDVIFTWRAILNPNNFSLTHFGYDIVSRIDKADPYTIIVHLKRPFAPFIGSFFAQGAGQAMCILPEHILSKYPNINRAPYNSHPIGTGPFFVSSYEPGSRIVLLANRRYWRGPPKLARIDFRIIGSDNTMLTLMQSHAIDFFYRAPETMAASLRNIPGTRVVLTPIGRFYDIGFNGRNFALADERVRRALAYATDRRALMEKIAHGVAEPARTFLPEFSWAFNAHAPDYIYDLERSKALLEKAGWQAGDAGIRTKDGRPLALVMSSFTGSATVNAAEVLLQAEWRQAGVDVTIKNYPSGQFYATLGAGGIEQTGKFDVSVENWANSPDPDDSILFGCTMTPPAGWNIYHYCSPTVDRLEGVALSAYDRPTRRQAYLPIQSIINEGLPFYVLWYQEQLDVVNTDLQHYRPAHAATPFWNTWEWSI
jgi:peptide/nickel transport system substrate-binding protein